MAVERSNPLPLGRYWVDVPAVSRESFSEWLSTNQSFVHVISTESANDIDWYLFETLTPYVEWQGPGLPTIASPDIQSKDDTAERPPPEKDPLDQLDDIIPSTSSLMWAGGIIAAVLLAAALRRR